MMGPVMAQASALALALALALATEKGSEIVLEAESEQASRRDQARLHRPTKQALAVLERQSSYFQHHTSIGWSTQRLLHCKL